MTLRPDPFTEIREALKTSLLHRPELDHDPASFADFTGSGRCEPDCEGCAALAALDTLEREAAEQETALAELREINKGLTADHNALVQANARWATRAEIASSRVREVEAERDRLKDATTGLANAAESFIHSFSGHIGQSYLTADTLTRSIGRARAVLASPEAAAAEPPEVCDDCQDAAGCRSRGFCEYADEAAALPAVDAPLLNERHYAIWDGCHDDPITVAEMRAVAANWRDTTQLANALDAAATKIERLAVDAPPEPTT